MNQCTKFHAGLDSYSAVGRQVETRQLRNDTDSSAETAMAVSHYFTMFGENQDPQARGLLSISETQGPPWISQGAPPDWWKLLPYRKSDVGPQWNS